MPASESGLRSWEKTFLENYNVSLIKGSLPSGLKFESIDIRGEPTKKAVTAKFKVKVTDQEGHSVSGNFSIKIFPALKIKTNNLPKGKAGKKKKYRATLQAVGGKKPYAWSLVSGSLPGGLSLDSSTGKIAGIPTASERFDLTFQMVDALGGEASKDFSLDIN